MCILHSVSIPPVRLSFCQYVSSPLPLCFFHAVFLSSVCLQKLPLLRSGFLRNSAVLFFFPNSCEIYTLSHPSIPSQNRQVVSLGLPQCLFIHRWGNLPRISAQSLQSECTLHRQTVLFSCPASVAACETTATWIWLFKGREPWNFQLPTHLTHLLVRRTFFWTAELKTTGRVNLKRLVRSKGRGGDKGVSYSQPTWTVVTFASCHRSCPSL